MAKALILLPFFACIFLRLTAAWPSGAPSGTCSSMKPSPLFHSFFQSENPELKYSIVVNSSTYTPGRKLTVTIEALSDKDRFKGFLIQARKQGEEEEGAVGTFEEESLPAQTQIITCNDKKGSAVTHSERGNHSALTFTWIPPVTETFSNIKFVATIVKSRTEFWIKHSSQTISFKSEECFGEEEIAEKNGENESGSQVEKESTEKSNEEKKEKIEKRCRPKLGTGNEEVKEKKKPDSFWDFLG